MRVRRKKVNKEKKFTKMSLQLYQVDYKSYLLDFKSLSNEEDPLPMGKNILPLLILLQLHWIISKEINTK